MQKITKTYEIYEFDELSKEKQESIKKFNFDSFCRNRIVGGKKLDTKFMKALVKYVDKEVRKLPYFKNGEIASI